MWHYGYEANDLDMKLMDVKHMSHSGYATHATLTMTQMSHSELWHKMARSGYRINVLLWTWK